jgi:hypothetical protein
MTEAPAHALSRVFAHGSDGSCVLVLTPLLFLTHSLSVVSVSYQWVGCWFLVETCSLHFVAETVVKACASGMSVASGWVLHIKQLLSVFFMREVLHHGVISRGGLGQRLLRTA